MRCGLLCFGIEPFARPEWMADAARSAEGHGFENAAAWVNEVAARTVDMLASR